jgi:hypothetical protein
MEHKIEIMKIKTFITCIVAMIALCTLSCNNDEEQDLMIENSKPFYIYGELFPADGITGIELHAVENFRGLTSRPTDTPVSDYSTFQLYGKISSGPLWCLDTKFADYPTYIQTSVTDMQQAFEKERTNFIREAFIAAYGVEPIINNASELRKWPYLYTGYINGDITISCDKRLFGTEPGKDISRHFNVYGTAECVPIGRENPTILYNFLDQKPKAISELMKKDTWLQRWFFFYFQDIPEEKYDTLTFKLTMPITREHYTRYFYGESLGRNDTLKVTNDTCISECKVVFNQNREKSQQ